MAYKQKGSPFQRNFGIGKSPIKRNEDDLVENVKDVGGVTRVDETLYNNIYQLSDLNSDQVYFWRVQPINICGTWHFLIHFRL